MILHREDGLCGFWRRWLEPLGWTCDCRGAGDDFMLAADDCPALIMMDAALEAKLRTAFLSTLRAMPGPVAGTPVLLLADADAPGQNGAQGRIGLPLRREHALGVIEHWAGPLEDHIFRDLSSPHYRLVRLAGRTSADRLLLSFANHVEAALGRLDGTQDIARAAHDIAGLAGTLGYGELSRLWSAVERGESVDPAEARTATHAVLDTLKHLFPKE
ncbi:MAG TPA: hypothetical protein VF463_07415 [Sphingobium sp.]